MNYLVTGPAGFIGSTVCDFLLREGHDVVGIDSFTPYYDLRLKNYRIGRLLQDSGWKTANYAKRSDRGRFHFQHGSIDQPEPLQSLFREFKFDAVFHLAGQVGVRYSMENPRAYLAANAVGTLEVLEAMRIHGVKKIVMASTSSLYAGEPMPFVETLPVNTPRSPYAASKKAGELMAFSYHELYGIDVTVLRYFTVFGPAGRPDMSYFRFIQWIDNGQEVQVHGDGTQARDFTYVDDIARGTIAAARPLGYEIINLGGGNQPLPLRSMIQIIEKMLGKKALCHFGPVHATDMTATQADISKARKLLGWTPQISPEEGLARCVAWHKEQRDWLKDVKL